MKILSLFDGISCARIALERAGIPVELYLASEVDEYATRISKKNWPDIVQLGDVRNVLDVGFGIHFTEKYGEIDLLIGGSPCQDLSIARRSRSGIHGEKSGLFWEYLRIWNEVQPKYFILENVASMSDLDRDTISNALSTEPIMIDAALVSAQNRKRLFWTNIHVSIPEDRGIVLKDIVDELALRRWIEPKNPHKTKNGVRWDTSGKGYFSQNDRAYSILGKHPTVPTARTITKAKVLFESGAIGVLNWNEIERLQSLPDDYTDLGEDNRLEKRGGCIGNGFNVEVITHILRAI